MRRFKKQISVMTLLLFMCCFIMPVLPATTAEAAEGTSLTDAQISAVINWAYGNQNSKAECLGFVYQAYYNAIGVKIGSGPGGSYSNAIVASRNLPLHKGDAPRGAIVFWEAAPGNYYRGHAGISLGNGRAISANVTIPNSEYRVGEHNIEGWLLYEESIKISNRKLAYIGWAWPYGYDTSAGATGITPINVTIQNNAIENITENNAKLSAKVLNNYQQVTEVGCYLGTDGSNWPYKASDAVNITDAYTNVWYDNTARDFGLALQPGTTYYYKFYAVVSGKSFEGPVGSFTTAGQQPPVPTQPVTPTQPIVPPTSSGSNSAGAGIILQINGQTIATPVAALIENGTTLVPLRVISESLGAKVSWNQSTQTVTIEKDGTKIRLQIGNTMVEVNGAFGKTLAVAPQIKAGTTMVPLRFISETLGCQVTWNAADQKIDISTNQNQTEQPKPESKPAVKVNHGEKISTSSWHTMVVKNDGTLWSWGDNLGGRLGTGSDRPGSSNVPIQIATNVKSVSASGFRHCMMLKTDGSLWGWGDNGFGELGIGNTTNQLQPVKVMDNVAMVSVGSYHTVAVKTDGSLWAWGHNRIGAVKNGASENVLSPIKVMDNIVMANAGDKCTFAIDKNGDLYGWGQNNAGKVGIGKQSDSVTTPIKIMSGVAYVSAGTNHNAAIKTDGSLWTWGDNSNGQLGTGVEDVSSYVPVKVLDNVASVQCSLNNTLAVKKDGSLWMWGKNEYGQLKSNNKKNVLVPTKIMDGVKEADLGYGHVAVLKTDGGVYTWGWNGHGQLGNGKDSSTVTPVKVLGV